MPRRSRSRRTIGNRTGAHGDSQGLDRVRRLLSAAIVIGEVTNVAGGGRVDPRTLANWVLTVVCWSQPGVRAAQAARPRHYWRPAFWVLLFATLVTIVPAALAGRAAMIVVATLLAFVVPAFVATYRYAYAHLTCGRQRRLRHEPAPVMSGRDSKVIAEQFPAARRRVARVGPDG